MRGWSCKRTKLCGIRFKDCVKLISFSGVSFDGSMCSRISGDSLESFIEQLAFAHLMPGKRAANM